MLACADSRTAKDWAPGAHPGLLDSIHLRRLLEWAKETGVAVASGLWIWDSCSELLPTAYEALGLDLLWVAQHSGSRIKDSMHSKGA